MKSFVILQVRQDRSSRGFLSKVFKQMNIITGYLYCILTGNKNTASWIYLQSMLAEQILIYNSNSVQLNMENVNPAGIIYMIGLTETNTNSFKSPSFISKLALFGPALIVSLKH